MSNDILSALYARIADIRCRISESQRKINNYKAILSRLKTAYNDISDLKDDFRKYVTRKDERILDNGYEWEGCRHTTFENSLLSDVNAENENYHTNSLDYVHDQLNDEMTRIENLIIQEQGILSGLRQTLNNLLNQIQNLLN